MLLSIRLSRTDLTENFGAYVRQKSALREPVFFLQYQPCRHDICGDVLGSDFNLRLWALRCLSEMNTTSINMSVYKDISVRLVEPLCCTLLLRKPYRSAETTTRSFAVSLSGSRSKRGLLCGRKRSSGRWEGV